VDVDPPVNRSHWKVSVVVPTLNEEMTVGDVLFAVKPFSDELVVVDGNSTDRTRTIAEEMGVRIVNDDGKGKGSAIRQGLRVASYPIVVFIDADGSHEPADVPKLVAPIREDRADIVIGSRMTGGSDELFSDLPEFIRLTGSMLINLAINYRWNIRLSDAQNGFRAVVRDMTLALDTTEHISTIEQEMVMKALARGYRIMNIASHEYRRKGGESKIVVSRVWFRYVMNALKHVLRPSSGRH